MVTQCLLHVVCVHLSESQNTNLCGGSLMVVNKNGVQVLDLVTKVNTNGMLKLKIGLFLLLYIFILIYLLLYR